MAAGGPGSLTVERRCILSLVFSLSHPMRKKDA